MRHLLDRLDGSYLHCDKRLADAGSSESVWFEPSKGAQLDAYLAGEEARPYLEALDETSKLVEGFESPLGMEALSTVDWLLSEEGCEPTVTSLRKGLKDWPFGEGAPERKLRIFSDRMLGLALGRLRGVASA